MKLPLKEIKGIRILSSGTTTVSANTTVVLDTKTVNANEVVFVSSHVTNSVLNAQWGEGNFSPAISDYVNLYFKKNGFANGIQLIADNNNPVSSRTVQWAIIAIQL
jgi:hypothetical protein